jgi:RNA polymerase-interacting CarD/CdnL/TRCF family regulator
MLAVTVLVLVVLVVPVSAAVVVGVRPVVRVRVLDAAVAMTLSSERLVRRDGMV